MNRKQVKALKPGDVVKGWRGGSGKYHPFEFEVVSNEIVIVGADATIRAKTMAWPQGTDYKWYMPPMYHDTGRTYPHTGETIYQRYDPNRGSWEVGKEVFVETRYLRDVEADAERARVLSAQREQEREEERARREAFDGRRRAWQNWLRSRGAEQGTAHRGPEPTMVVNVTPHEAFELVKDLKVETRFSMVFVLDELGNVVGFGGGIGPE